MLQPNLQTMAPLIRTELPGPLAKKLIESDHQYTSPSYTRVYPLAVRKGEGAVIEDLDGNLFLDFTAGIAVCASGHCHPRVVEAIQRQSENLLHMSGTDFYNAPQRDLAKKLAELAPGNSPKKVFFTNSGAESVEAAFKLARYHTGRPLMISFFGAFHGRTMGAVSLTGSKAVQRSGFAPLVPGVTHVDYADCYRCPLNLKYESCRIKCVSQIEDDLFRRTVPPEEVAAFIVEPIQGEGGYIVPPPEFHHRLKALAEKHGILYIADEVQSGMGRTGKMFAIDHWGVVPDIVCLAKGIASGMPLGAMIADESVMDWPPGAHASTFGGNPVCCAAALETIALLEESLMENATRMGEVLMQKLKVLQAKHPSIGDVRGRGLMIGVDLVVDRDSKKPAKKLCNDVVQACFHKGLLLLSCGESSVRLAPPLMIDSQQAETAVDIIDAVLTDLE